VVLLLVPWEFTDESENHWGRNALHSRNEEKILKDFHHTEQIFLQKFCCLGIRVSILIIFLKAPMPPNPVPPSMAQFAAIPALPAYT
jgi:hypothetical protein